MPGKPGDYGIDAAALDSLYSTMDQDPHRDLKGIVIVRDGHLVNEHYFNGDSVDTLHDIRSATKSLTSLLMGIAVQKGLVHSVDDSIALYLLGLPKDGKERIAIKDLLTMRSGLDAYDNDASSPGNENTRAFASWGGQYLREAFPATNTRSLLLLARCSMAKPCPQQLSHRAGHQASRTFGAWPAKVAATVGRLSSR